MPRVGLYATQHVACLCYAGLHEVRCGPGGSCKEVYVPGMQELYAWHQMPCSARLLVNHCSRLDQYGSCECGIHAHLSHYQCPMQQLDTPDPGHPQAGQLLPLLQGKYTITTCRKPRRRRFSAGFIASWASYIARDWRCLCLPQATHCIIKYSQHTVRLQDAHCVANLIQVCSI